jgi:long-chain acyl-CoA synthetase
VNTIGEIVVSSPNLSLGYYHDPELTAEVFVDGWYHTGDIGKRVDVDQFVILGRTSSAIRRDDTVIFPGALEAIYEASPLVLQLFLDFVESSNVLGIVVVPKYGDCTVEQLRQSFLQIAESAQLSAAELPSRIVIEPEPWTVDNNCLTAQLKIARGVLHQKYLHHFQQ